ncbi:MAG: tRNA (N6-isopentenyl adenosine(37)-C2)-methylthiotransferase MiaB [Bacilli bacterium]|nr:tRNA (N6-isopentenyl adenosine(37)-C2)-methylthiotransferase MiaB [Bacilli bacterium]
MKIEYINTPDMGKARRRTSDVDTIDYSYVPSEVLKDKFFGKKVYVRTYGCQANIRDEETMLGLLSTVGVTKTEEKGEADIAILNTCAVRENAEDKVYAEIGEFKHYKQKNKNLILILCGCMVEQKHIVDDVLVKFPHVDIFFGTHDVQDLLKLLDMYINKKRRYIDVSSKEGSIIENLPVKRLDNAKAFVNITYGCDKFCTYCIVPYTRGKERSRNAKDIIKECRELVEEGYQEITLLGQNVDAYGKDLKGGLSFAELLEEVAKLGIPRLRFLTSYPTDFKDEVIDVMAKYDNIMKYLHFPIQSGSDDILKKMGRRYTSDQYLEIVRKIRAKIPNIALSTDIIVGFPNETYDDVKKTIEVSLKADYSSAFTFIYSPRNGTPAAKLKDDVSSEEKVKRFKELVKALEVNFEKHANEMVGTIQKVLVEGPSKKNKDVLSGYTESNKVVNFKGDKTLIGKIINVKITESHVYSLTGEIVNG